MAPKRNQHTAAKKTSGPRVNNKVELDPHNPVPFDLSPSAYYVSLNGAYLPFIGQEDHLAHDLAQLRTLSVTHSACITTKARYCAGVGVEDTEDRELPKEITTWFKAMNLHGQGITKLTKQILEEFLTFGNVPIEIVRVKSGKQKKLFVYVHSLLEWRLGQPNADDICKEAVHSKLFLGEWGGIRQLKDEHIKVIPIYNPFNSEKDNWYVDENGAERTIIWYKNNFTGVKYYGLPAWAAAIIYALLEYKSARYNLDNFENNMVVATILALKGTISQKETDAIARKIIRQHTGDGKRGRTVVVSSETGVIDGSDLHKIDTKTDGSFTQADESWMQKLILAHEWDAVLAGLMSASSIGKGSGFLTKILEHKLATVIRPMQAELMCDVFTHIFDIAEKWLSLPFSQYTLGIKNAIDISGLTDVDVTTAVTKNEVREAKGLPKRDDGDEYMQTKQGGNNVSS